MEHQHSSFLNGARRLFGGLYRDAGTAESVTTPDHPDTPKPARGLAAEYRLAMLAEISDFFCDHDIRLSGRNLMLIHDLVSNQDPELRARYDARVRSGCPVNEAWLECVEADYTTRKSAKLNSLVSEFESQLTIFRQETRNVRETTEDYGAELAHHVDNGLNEPDNAAALAGLARQMLERTRDIGLAMRSSEQETEHLQRRLEKAKQEAETDQLTGLPNRRAFEDQFAKQVEIAKKRGSSLCIAFCDIDHFKGVNDRHGHEAGDRVLKRVSQVLGKVSNNDSFVSRHGGEEFVLLFSEMGMAKATARLNRAREQLCAKEMVNRETGLSIGHVSFSAGIVEVMGFANPRDALQAADAALYQAKANGRNQVISA